MNELLEFGSNENLANAFDQFSMKLSHCRGHPTRLATLLSSASSSIAVKYRSGARIPIQPTSKNRRKNVCTRGSASRQPSGRPPKALKGQLKCGRVPLQKTRKLAKAIKENRPNAKSHD